MEDRAAATRKHYNKRRDDLNELKGCVCSRCENTFPSYVLEFHHRDPRDKLFNLSGLASKKSWEAVLEEVRKCDVLCANCHRIVEYAS